MSGDRLLADGVSRPVEDAPPASGFESPEAPGAPGQPIAVAATAVELSSFETP